MAEVKVYRTTYCPYCDMAKRFLSDMDVDFVEVDVTEDHDMRMKLVQLTGGRRTVPQIFVGETSIGGYTDMIAMHKKGELQPLLDSEG